MERDIARHRYRDRYTVEIRVRGKRTYIYGEIERYKEKRRETDKTCTEECREMQRKNTS